MEEVDLNDYEPRGGGSGSRNAEAYHEDSDDEMGGAGGPRVACANQ